MSATFSLLSSPDLETPASGGDVTIGSETGSGKSLAYLMPIIDDILQRKQKQHSESDSSSSRPGYDYARALILVPNKELVQQGYEGVTLQLKFIECYDLYRDNATMFAHEGRHSLDRIVLQGEYSSLGTATIEYRARLSQIVFSESPKLELANMSK